MRLPSRCAPGSRRGGFTIVEVILALGILMIGMSVILSLMTFGAGLSRDAELRSESAAVARAVVADLEEHLFTLDDDGVVGPPAVIIERPVVGYDELVYSAHAVLNPDRADELALAETPGAVLERGPLEYRVDVILGWKSRGERRGRTFSVLLTRELSFGARLRQMLVDSKQP